MSTPLDVAEKAIDSGGKVLETGIKNSPTGTIKDLMIYAIFGGLLFYQVYTSHMDMIVNNDILNQELVERKKGNELQKQQFELAQKQYELSQKIYNIQKYGKKTLED